MYCYCEKKKYNNGPHFRYT